MPKHSVYRRIMAIKRLILTKRKFLFFLPSGVRNLFSQFFFQITSVGAVLLFLFNFQVSGQTLHPGKNSKTLHPGKNSIIKQINKTGHLNFRTWNKNPSQCLFLDTNKTEHLKRLRLRNSFWHWPEMATFGQYFGSGSGFSPSFSLTSS